MNVPALDPEELALLGFIYRHSHGGPPAPSRTGSFGPAYVSLHDRGLIVFSSERQLWTPTATGDELLRGRRSDSPA